MKRKKNIFTTKKHSEKAIMSMILGIISLLSMLVVIYLTFQNGGKTQKGYGLTGLFAAIYTLIGLVLGCVTLKDKGNYKLFPIIGIVLNGLVLIGIFFLLYLGRL